MRKKKALNKKNARTQAALEYLMTYGWALILLVTTASFLFIAGIGGFNRNSCQINFAFLCKGVYTEGDTIKIILQNATARRIIINPFEGIAFDNKAGYGTINYAGEEYRFEEATIPSGSSFEIEGEGMALAKQASLTYTEVETGQTKTATIGLTTDTPKTTEISNDAIDNDNDTKTDCAQTGITDCQYVSGATIIATLFVTNSSWTDIGFGQLKGTSGNTLPGNWKAKSVILVFYVDSFTSGTKPKIAFRGVEISSQAELKQGWNTVEITNATASTFFSGATTLTVSLESQGAQFTISNDAGHRPKAIFVINKFP